jgi:dynein heavy chain
LDECVQVLFIFLEAGSKDKYCASRIPPPNYKTKCVFLTKMEPSVPDSDFEHLISFSEFANAPLPMILALTQEVYFPLLTNPRNQEGWPEVITKEVQESLHRFLAQVYITIGNTQGKTFLPLPPNHGAALIDNSGRDKDRIHLLESAVVMWTKQIKGILKQDPETALKNGHPGPEVEMEFWDNKADNLNSLHTQLSGEKIRKVVKVLEVTKSTYFPAFNRLCKEVAQARMEANDNIVYLKPLVGYFSKLQDDFAELIPVFRPTLHTLLLIWKNSKFYNTPARFVVIMRELCNTIIFQAMNFLTADGSLFENTEEPEKRVESLKQCLKVCITVLLMCCACVAHVADEVSSCASPISQTSAP